MFGEPSGLSRKSLLKGTEAFGGGWRDADLTCILPSSLLKVFPISHVHREPEGKGAPSCCSQMLTTRHRAKERARW